MQFGTIIIETLTPLLPYSRRRPARVRGGGAGGPQDSKGAGADISGKRWRFTKMFVNVCRNVHTPTETDARTPTGRVPPRGGANIVQ